MATPLAATTNAAARQSSAIEFVVVPQEDLYLEGGIRKLFRVAKGVLYPCQMQKNQTFRYCYTKMLLIKFNVTFKLNFHFKSSTII